MRIGFTTFGCDAGRSGIGKYAQALLREMPPLAPDDRFVVAVTESEREIYATGSPNVEVDVFPAKLSEVRPSLLWHLIGLGRWARRRRLDVVFVPAGNRRLPWWSPVPVVGCVHDLSGFHVDAKYDALRMFYIRRVLPRLIGRLHTATTVSESSRRDIDRHTSAKAVVIPNGYDSRVFHPAPRPTRETVAKYIGKPVPYWIYVSRLEHPGKNHVKLMQAYETLLKERPDAPHLVCAGGDWDGAEEVHRYHESSPARSQVHLTGFVQDGDLGPLVAEADACVYPSLYEGFGIPVIEAMACGVPVACSNTSSLPEVAGDAALLFDPSEPAAIAEAMRRLAADQELVDDLRRRGIARSALFPWAKCAERTLAVVRAAGARS